jgi:hypothetical protein
MEIIDMDTPVDTARSTPIPSEAIRYVTYNGIYVSCFFVTQHRYLRTSTVSLFGSQSLISKEQSSGTITATRYTIITARRC